MARFITDQRNTWGSSGDTQNPQRADLWVLNLQQVIKGLNSQITDQVREQTSLTPGQTTPNAQVVSQAQGLNVQLTTQANGNPTLTVLEEVRAFFAQSVDLPELKVNAEKYYRDSKPYMMPAYDEPLGGIKVVFFMDSPFQLRRSRIYRLLDTWRAFVRAGRGDIAGEAAILLNANYRIDYAFPVMITLLRGSADLSILGAENYTDQALNNNSIANDYPELQALPIALQSARLAQILNNTDKIPPATVDNDLVTCGEYILDKAWLSSFKMTQFDYKVGNTLTMIEAVLYAESIRDKNA